MAEITFEFLAAQQERVLQELATMRNEMRDMRREAHDDLNVTAAIVQRLDGTVQGLLNEHSRYSRLDRRVRALEETP